MPTIAPDRRELESFCHRFGYQMNDPDLIAHFEREQRHPHLTDIGLPGEIETVRIDAPLSPEDELAKLSRDWHDLQPRVIAGDPLAVKALALVEKKLKAVQSKINTANAERDRIAKEQRVARTKATEEAIELGKQRYVLAKAADEAIATAVREKCAPLIDHCRRHRAACEASGVPIGALPEVPHGQRFLEAATVTLKEIGADWLVQPNYFRPLTDTEYNPNNNSNGGGH